MPRAFVLSPTKIRTFQTCPAKYRLEYIEKLGRFYRRPRAGFSFGHSLHRVLDQFHQVGGAQAMDNETMQATLEQAWVAQGYQSPAQEAAYRQEAQRIVEAYHAAAVAAQREAPPDAPPAPRLLFTEKTLAMPLSPDIRLSGRVDRIDEHHDGALEIVDYKSGRDSVTPEDVAGALAMGIYQTLLKHAHPERRVFATLVALRTGAAASHEQTPQEREHLTAACLETGETLRNKDWENILPVVNAHCPDCDYLPHCTRYFRQQGIAPPQRFSA